MELVLALVTAAVAAAAGRWLVTRHLARQRIRRRLEQIG